MSKIDEAKACNDKGSISWTINLDDVEQIVKDFKKVHPDVKHSVSIDWDDDTLYKIRVSWEPGTFGLRPKKKQSSSEAVPSPPVQRYGGPRW